MISRIDDLICFDMEPYLSLGSMTFTLGFAKCCNSWAAWFAARNKAASKNCPRYFDPGQEIPKLDFGSTKIHLIRTYQPEFNERDL